MRGLQPDQMAVVRISAVRAIWGFCQHLKRREDRRVIILFLKQNVTFSQDFVTLTDWEGNIFRFLLGWLCSRNCFVRSRMGRKTALRPLML